MSTINRQRFMAALALRDQGIRDVANAVGCTYHHLYYALRGERAISKNLLAEIRKYLGDEAWRYVTQAADTLVRAAS